MRFDIKNEAHRKKLRNELAFYSLASDYKGAGKFLHISEDYVTEGGFPLGRICKRLRDDCQQGRLDADDIRFLLELRMPLADSPKKNLRIWLDRADDAEAYYHKHGTLSMPSAELFPDGASMFQWVHHQKKLYKRGSFRNTRKPALKRWASDGLRLRS